MQTLFTLLKIYAALEVLTVLFFVRVYYVRRERKPKGKPQPVAVPPQPRGAVVPRIRSK